MRTMGARWTAIPNVEKLGYYRKSLRDKTCLHFTSGWRQRFLVVFEFAVRSNLEFYGSEKFCNVLLSHRCGLESPRSILSRRPSSSRFRYLELVILSSLW